MRSVTARRVARRGWQLEQAFWNLKQLLDHTAIHQQSRKRVIGRVMLVFFVAQAAIDSARSLKTTVNRLHRTLRRNHQALLREIALLCPSVRNQDPRSAGHEPLAA